MVGISQLVSYIVVWGVVPIIMFALFALSVSIVTRATDDAKASAVAGFWAGLVLFVLQVVSSIPSIEEPTFELAQFPGLLAGQALVGCLFGLGIAVGRRVLGDTRMAGILTLILAFASADALFNYVFIESLRGSMLYLALGTAFGVLIYAVFDPRSARHLS